jgi:hypothetical protein
MIPGCGGGASNLVTLTSSGSMTVIGAIGHAFVAGLTFAPEPVALDATSWGRVKALYD